MKKIFIPKQNSITLGFKKNQPSPTSIEAELRASRPSIEHQVQEPRPSIEPITFPYRADTLRAMPRTRVLITLKPYQKDKYYYYFW